MTWIDTKWLELLKKWHELIQNDLKWYKMTCIDMMNWHTMITCIDTKWHKLIQNDRNWHKLTWIDTKWQNGTQKGSKTKEGSKFEKGKSPLFNTFPAYHYTTVEVDTSRRNREKALSNTAAVDRALLRRLATCPLSPPSPAGQTSSAQAQPSRAKRKSVWLPGCPNCLNWPRQPGQASWVASAGLSSAHCKFL